MMDLALAALKFLSLGTATTLGIVATLTRTRDETTHKITRGGRTLVALIIVSGMISALTQSAELHLASKEKQNDRNRRLQEYAVLYDLTHPLGDLNVHINATYPIVVAGNGVGAKWLRRVDESVPRQKIVLNQPDNPLRPDRDIREEEGIYDLLVEPEFDISINRLKTKSDENDRFSGHDDLYFRTTTPSNSMIYAHLDQKKVDSQIKATAVRLFDKGNIQSWRDLYGATITIHFPRGTPLGSKFSRCTISFSTGARFAFRRFSIPDDGLLTKSSDSHIGCQFILTEDVLGPIPRLLD